jgi:hypothetical protein
MKIKMLKTRQGSPDGLVVNTYMQGETVEVPDELARIFISQSWARKVPIVKDRGKAPENKNRVKKIKTPVEK